MAHLPGHDRRARRRRRLVRDGDSYTRDEERDSLIELEQRDPDPDPPPENTRGEPWGWTKGPPYPRGWPGPDGNRDDPGPFDGAWDPPGEGS